jgi:hypothetical protein
MAVRQPVKLRRADIPVDVRRAIEETGSFSMSAEPSTNYPLAKRILRDKYPVGEIKDFGYAWIGVRRTTSRSSRNARMGHSHLCRFGRYC